MRGLTSSSRHEKGRNDDETVPEDDVGVLTSSSRHEKGRNDDETVREDDVGVLTSSSRTIGEGGKAVGMKAAEKKASRQQKRKRQGSRNEGWNQHKISPPPLSRGIVVLKHYHPPYQTFMKALPVLPSTQMTNSSGTRTWRRNALSETAGRESSQPKSTNSPRRAKPLTFT